MPTGLRTYVVVDCPSAEFKYPTKGIHFPVTKVELQLTAQLEPVGQQADQVLVRPEEQMMKDKEGKEEKKKKSTKKKEARVSMNITGATFGTVSGGTVHANTTAATGHLYVQHGENSQQKNCPESTKSESESEDEESFTDLSSD